MRFQMLPQVVEAFCWKEQPQSDWPKWLAGPNFTLNDRGQYSVYNSLYDCWLTVPKDYWIVLGAYGELFPVRPDVFADRFDDGAGLKKAAEAVEAYEDEKPFWKKKK